MFISVKYVSLFALPKTRIYCIFPGYCDFVFNLLMVNLYGFYFLGKYVNYFMQDFKEISANPWLTYSNLLLKNQTQFCIYVKLSSNCIFPQGVWIQLYVTFVLLPGDHNSFSTFQ